MDIASIGAPPKDCASAVIDFRHAQWRMLLAAMFCYLFFYTGRQTFGFAIPGIQAEFGVSKETLGWASAAMLWSYALGQAVNGNLADKFGGRRMMSAGAILSCGMNWAVSFAGGVFGLGILWSVNGYVQAMGWAPGSRVISNWWGRHERGRVFGCYLFAAGLASVLSYCTSLIVVQELHLGWRWIFRLPVLLLLVGGVTFYLVARERPEDMGFASPDDDAIDPSEASAVADDESSLECYKTVLGNWRLLIGGVAIGFQNAARYGLLVWVPVHFLGPDWAKADTASAAIDPRWISVALPIGMAIGAVTNGWMSDRFFNARRYLAIVLYMSFAAGTALYMYTIPVSDVSRGLVVLFLCGFFVYGPQSSFWALCPDLAGPKRAGTAIGVMNFFAYAFAGFGEPLIGRFMDAYHNTSLVFLVVAAASAASAFVALFIRR